MVLLKVQIFITFILLSGHFSVLLLGKDVFPFSPYPMYSKRFTPDAVTFKKIFLNNQKEVRIRTYYPYFWHSLFIESLLYTNTETDVCKKLISIGEVHERLIKEKINSIQLVEYKIPWESFTKNPLKSDKGIITEKKLIYDCHN
jgi:hypothetical protein